MSDAPGRADTSDGRVKVLRVIARLNVGGPALHVAYLTSGLAERGYDTTLVAGSIARGEESMAFVADERGVEVEPLVELHREISAVRDLRAMLRLAQADPARAAARSCTRTPRRPARSDASPRCSRGDARPPIVVHTFHGHVLRGYFNRLATFGFRTLERWLARTTDRARRSEPGGAGRPRRTPRRAGDEVHGRAARHRPRQPGRQRRARSAARRAGRWACARTRSSIGWVGRMTAVKRTDDVVPHVAGARRARRGRVRRARRRRPRPRPARAVRATSSE